MINVKGQKTTAQRFGDYIDKYKLQDAVDDKATVQILYEGKTADTAINEKSKFDEKVDELAQGYVTSQMRKTENVEIVKKIAQRENRAFDDLMRELSAAEVEALKKKWGTTGDIFEAEQRIEAIAADMVQHYIENILPNGKSTFVARTFIRFGVGTRSAGLSGCKPPGLVACGFCVRSGRSCSVVVSRRSAQQSGCVAKGQLEQVGVAVHGGRVSAVLTQLGFTRRGWRSPPSGLLPQNAGQGEGQG